MSTATTSSPQFSQAPPSRVGLAARGSATAAMIVYLLSVVAAKFASVHWPPFVVGGLFVPAGTVFAGTGLTARDLAHDTLGARGVAVGIAAGAGCPPCSPPRRSRRPVSSRPPSRRSWTR